MATELASIEQRIQALLDEREKLFEQTRPLNKRLEEAWDEISALTEQRAQIQYSADTPPDWPSIVKDMADDTRSSMHLIRYAEKHLREQFDMWNHGRWEDTNETSIALKVERNEESNAKNLAGVKFFTGILSPHEDGLVWFKIFENSLSRHGIYTLRVKKDLSYLALTFERYHRLETIKTFSSAEAAIQYISLSHYYGEPDHESDDLDNSY